MRTGKSRWGTGPENMVDAKTILATLPSFSLTCDTMNPSVVSSCGSHFYTELSDIQIIVKDMSKTLLLYLSFISYLNQPHFTVLRNDFMDFLMFSSVTALFGRPKGPSSSVLIWPVRNSEQTVNERLLRLRQSRDNTHQMFFYYQQIFSTKNCPNTKTCVIKVLHLPK